jgi:hypothetical protein
MTTAGDQSTAQDNLNQVAPAETLQTAEFEPTPNPQPSAETPGTEIASDAVDWLESELPSLQVWAGANVRGGIGDVLERVTRPPIDETSVGRIYDAVYTLIGDESATNFLLLLMSRATREPELLDALRERTDDETVAWLRWLTAMYGEPLRRARLLEVEEPFGWLAVNRWVTKNYITNALKIRIEIVRNVGDRVEIIDSPTNITSLASALVKSLIFIPDEDLAVALEPQALEDLTEQCAQLARSIREFTERSEIPDAPPPSGTDPDAREVTTRH